MIKTNDLITDFDSATSMLFALSEYLQGHPFRHCGIAAGVPDFAGQWINKIPRHVRTRLYAWSGWLAAKPFERLDRLKQESIAAWSMQYPKRRYPAIAVGSSNGALVHLYAALGIPWLPQTTLLSVRRRCHPDEIEFDAEWGKSAVRRFLPRNPDLAAYQMHDPLQDRLMVSTMGYFRLKQLRLGPVWEDFILRDLEPSGTLIISECLMQWPAWQLGPRHFFQIGGLGAVRPEEYLDGSPEIGAFLQEKKSRVRRWRLDAETEPRREAEWGLDDALFEDLRAFAAHRGFRLLRIRYAQPESVSPWIADLYRWWYQRLGREACGLLAENFVLLEPLWALTSGAIPLWLVFNTRPSAELLENYLRAHPELRKAYLMLMSNGVEKAAGLVPIERWRRILESAPEGGEFLGVDERHYPMDFGTFINYHPALEEKMKPRYALPASLTLEEFKLFAHNAGPLPDVELLWE